MKKLSSIMMIALAGLIFQACKNNAKNNTTAADSANQVKDTAKSTAMTGSMDTNQSDAQFAVEAANGGMAEVEMGKIAQQNAANPRVKSFGAMMIADHTKANNDLKGLAQLKNITLPAEVNNEEKKMAADLSKKTGKDFDKAYVDGMVSDHKKDIKDFEKAVQNCKDADIKAFATKTLPVLKMHLDSITAIQNSMKK